MSEKLQKVLAQQGVASRRTLEQWIAEGRVTVNGQIAHLGQRVTGAESIALDGKTVSCHTITPELLIYHKPCGQICTHHDPQGRETIYEHLPAHIPGKWQSIGRLDFNTSGLLLVTNDGELAHQWMHPRANLEREYHVRVRGRVDAQKCKQLQAGVMLEDGPAKAKYVQPIRGSGQNTWLKIVLTEGRNREVRRLMAAVDLQVSQLKRVRYAHISLPEDLPAGQWQPVEPSDQQPR